MWSATDLIAVELPPAEVPFAVPVEATTGFVGPSFMQYLADELGATLERDRFDIGLMDDFSVLRGRWLDPDKVNPLVVEFYEHTTRFTLSVRPKWNQWYRPAFWLFRTLIARKIGQFNLPFDERDEKRGLETHIDALDLDHDKIVDLRAWVRTYAGTTETISTAASTRRCGSASSATSASGSRFRTRTSRRPSSRRTSTATRSSCGRTSLRRAPPATT